VYGSIAPPADEPPDSRADRIRRFVKNAIS
jgi:hypothetical protein